MHTARPAGFGSIGAIPLFRAIEHADRLGMTPDESDWFVDLIDAMDRSYRKWVEEQKPKAP